MDDVDERSRLARIEKLAEAAVKQAAAAEFTTMVAIDLLVQKGILEKQEFHAALNNALDQGGRPDWLMEALGAILNYADGPKGWTPTVVEGGLKPEHEA